MKLISMKSAVRSVVAGAAAFGAGAAMAAVDIAADAAQAKTDITTAGGIIIGVLVAVAAISWIRRVVR